MIFRFFLNIEDDALLLYSQSVIPIFKKLHLKAKSNINSSTQLCIWTIRYNKQFNAGPNKINSMLNTECITNIGISLI